MSGEGTHITGEQIGGASFAAAGGPTTINIDADASPLAVDVKELWAYRELLYILVWRDIKVRYKQTVMGAAWVIVQPFANMVLFAFIFAKLKSVPASDVPYPLFAYSGLLLWTFFANSVSNATQSLISNANLVTKVYFPRLFIPAASVAASVLDFFVASTILVALMIYYRVGLTWNALWLPVFFALTALLALAAALVVSSVTVKFRDLRHVMPFALQVMMLASPVIYSSRIVEGRWRALLVVNPVSGLVEGFRTALFGGAFDPVLTAAAVVSTPVLLVVAVYVFRRIEDTFADVI